MNYSKIYNALVEKAKVRGLDKSQHEGYFEIHHIVPRSVGGTNEADNLVMLTGREHFIAHMLLWKIYPKVPALAYAAMMMSNRAISKVNSYLYEALKEDFSKKVSENRRGKIYKDLVGKKFTRLTVVELADFYEPPSGGRQVRWLCECDCGNVITVIGGSLTSKNTQSCGCLTVERGQSLVGENNPFFGKKHTDETKEKFKSRNYLRGEDHPFFGMVFSEERRKKMSEGRKGIPWTEERKANAVFRTGEDHHMFGKSHPPELLKQISESLKAREQRPWENLATQTEESLTKWSMCDYFYDLWVMFDKPGLKVFTKIYNQTHDDDVSLAFFTNPRLKWLDGWIPKEDPKWVEFSKGF